MRLYNLYHLARKVPVRRARRHEEKGLARAEQAGTSLDLTDVSAKTKTLLQGQEDLLDMKVGDKINYIKVLAGGENFLAPKM